MAEKPYDPTKFFDDENAAKTPKSVPQPEPDMTKPEVVADYIHDAIQDRIGGLHGDPAKIETAINTARDEILDRYHQLAERSQTEVHQVERDHDQADED